MESSDEWRARMRREQEQRNDRTRQDQQRRADQSRQDQQRREDKQKQDAIESRRRSDEQARLAESKRHNRAIESASTRDNSRDRVDAPAPQRRVAAASDSQSDYAPRRKGGFTKLIILAALIFGVIHFWSEISALGNHALSASSQSSGSTADHTPIPSNPQADEPAGPKEVEPVIAAKRAAKIYPRCSATITDQCQQDH